MGYRIHYGGEKRRSKKTSNSILVPFVIFIISMLLRLYIPSLEEKTRSLLFSDEAREVFSEAFSQASPYQDAVGVFYEEVFIH